VDVNFAGYPILTYGFLRITNVPPYLGVAFGVDVIAAVVFGGMVAAVAVSPLSLIRTREVIINRTNAGQVTSEKPFLI
jgi:hypothetical protein